MLFDIAANDAEDQIKRDSLRTNKQKEDDIAFLNVIRTKRVAKFSKFIKIQRL